jgi:hypothetical protein
MASIVENEKGFKVIQLSLEEAKSLNWGIPEGMVCMHCNELIEGDIYFPVLLNDTLDKECYEEWLLEAEYYPEDEAYEQKLFDYYCHKLGINSIM